MLQEIASTQRRHYKSKRWFTHSSMDLFIWFNDQMPACFQLCYKKDQQEYAINWHYRTGYSHHLVKPELNDIKYRIAPMHLSECEFDSSFVAHEFQKISNNIEAPLADFIFSRLIEYPHQSYTHLNQVPVLENSL